MVVVIIFGLFAHAHYTWRVILVPLSIIQLYGIALGIALLLGTLYVYYRDVAHIWEVILQAMFYAIPIIYSNYDGLQGLSFDCKVDFVESRGTSHYGY